jgi:hypothetical protein
MRSNASFAATAGDRRRTAWVRALYDRVVPK